MSKRNEDAKVDFSSFVAVNDFLSAMTDDATFFASVLDDMVAEYNKKSKDDGPAIKIASDD